MLRRIRCWIAGHRWTLKNPGPLWPEIRIVQWPMTCDHCGCKRGGL